MNNWNNLSQSQKADLMRIYLKNGISSLDQMQEHYNTFQSGGPVEPKDKEPNFVKRLKQGNSRKSIIDNEGNPASHKLSVADSRVYAEVQEDENGNLVDYGAIPYRPFYAYERAVKNKDYVEFPNDESAVNFTEHYKDAAIYPWYRTFDNYFPWRYSNGGHLYPDGSWLKTAASFLPIVGTGMDLYDFIKEPSWENAGWLAASLGTDFLSLVPGMQFGKAAFRSAKLAHKAKVAKALKEEEKARKAYNAIHRTTTPANARRLGDNLDRAINKRQFIERTGPAKEEYDFIKAYTAIPTQIANAGLNYIQQFPNNEKPLLNQFYQENNVPYPLRTQDLPNLVEWSDSNTLYGMRPLTEGYQYLETEKPELMPIINSYNATSNNTINKHSEILND